MQPNPAIMQTVQRSTGRDRAPARKVYGLAMQDVHPVVRIAQHVPMPLRIDWRIIVDHELVLILQGRGRLHIGDESLAYEPGSLLFLPPFVPHKFDAPAGGPSAHIGVHFDYARTVPRMVDTLPERTPYEVRLPTQFAIGTHTRMQTDDAVARLMARLAELNLADRLDELEASARVTDILLELWRRNTAPLPTGHMDAAFSLAERNQVRIDRAVRQIESDYASDLTAEALAETAGMSVSHCNRLFRAATGYAPLDYLRRHRIHRARALLANVDLSIKEIATAVGFADAFHFSKVFRKIDGLSPTQFRQAVLAGSMVAPDIE